LNNRIIGFSGEQRRKDQRRTVKDTYCVIEGETCKIINMSLRSFFCIGYKGTAKMGEEIIVEDMLMADDTRITVNAVATIVRQNALRKELGVVFVDINEKTFITLEKLMMLRPTSKDGGGRLE